MQERPMQQQQKLPAFLEWFGNSKVVTECGRPSVVYHGTAHDFRAFDLQRGGGVWGSSDSVGVMWFSSSPRRASAAAKDAATVKADADTSADAVILPAYLRIERPFYPTSRQISDPAVLGRAIQRARRSGCDGLIMPGEMGGVDLAVFHASQIKSAIGNRGAFSSTDPDICN